MNDLSSTYLRITFFSGDGGGLQIIDRTDLSITSRCVTRDADIAADFVNSNGFVFAGYAVGFGVDYVNLVESQTDEEDLVESQTDEEESDDFDYEASRPIAAAFVLAGWTHGFRRVIVKDFESGAPGEIIGPANLDDPTDYGYWRVRFDADGSEKEVVSQSIRFEKE